MFKRSVHLLLREVYKIWSRDLLESLQNNTGRASILVGPCHACIYRNQIPNTLEICAVPNLAASRTACGTCMHESKDATIPPCRQTPRYDSLYESWPAWERLQHRCAVR